MTLFARYACLLALMITLGSAAPVQVSRYRGESVAEWRAKLSADPRITVEEYSIHGRTAAELRVQMNALGPTDNSQRRGDAFTHWDVAWRWPMEEGRGMYESTVADFTATVIIPAWHEYGEADIELQQRWNKFLSAVLAHESNHVANAARAAQRMQESLRRRAARFSSSEDANAAARAIADEARQADARYDATTLHGHSEGVVFR